jgi:transcriptional regulator with XRE-family HTH domain
VERFLPAIRGEVNSAMDVGSQLRHAREERGLALDQLANRTKISLRHLRAIEQNGFDQLPGGLYTRGFLRAYAREVGLAPEEIVRRYVADYAPPEQAVSADPAHKGERSVDLSAQEMDSLERRLERGQLLGTAAIVLVGAVVYFMLARETPRQDMGPTVQVAPAATPQAAPRVGTGGTGSDEIPTGTVGRRAGVRVELQPKGPCWVGAVSDGKPVIQRLMNAGEQATIDAYDEAVVRVGDAATCSFSINGSRTRPVGVAGQAVTLRLTKQNYKDFLAP